MKRIQSAGLMVATAFCLAQMSCTESKEINRIYPEVEKIILSYETTPNCKGDSSVLSIHVFQRNYKRIELLDWSYLTISDSTGKILKSLDLYERGELINLPVNAHILTFKANNCKEVIISGFKVDPMNDYYLDIALVKGSGIQRLNFWH